MEITNLIHKLPWNPDRKWNTRAVDRISKIIVHQTLSEASLENVNNYHINPNHISDRGCPHICYHYGIRKNGAVAQMNAHNHLTWHCRGQNTVSIGVVLCGNFNGTGFNLGTSEPTNAQLKSLKALFNHLCQKLDLQPGDVYGHYHFGKPACPGQTVQNLIEGFRDKVLQQKEVAKTTREIQKRLAAQGFDPGPVDGIHGIKTAAAIRRFQKSSGLTVDGIVGPNTWAALLKVS